MVMVEGRVYSVYDKNNHEQKNTKIVENERRNCKLQTKQNEGGKTNTIRTPKKSENST
jgi:hypothetical protein